MNLREVVEMLLEDGDPELDAEFVSSVRQELQQRFDEMDGGQAIPTSDADFAQMVHERAAKYSGG